MTNFLNSLQNFHVLPVFASTSNVSGNINRDKEKYVLEIIKWS